MFRSIKENGTHETTSFNCFQIFEIRGKGIVFVTRGETSGFAYISNELGLYRGGGRILRKMSKNNAVIFYAISNAAPQGYSLRVRGETW